MGDSSVSHYEVSPSRPNKIHKSSSNHSWTL